MSLPCINGINEGTFIIFFLECLVGFIGQDFLFQNKFNILGKTYQLNILISLTSFCAGIFFGLLSIYKILKMENVTNKLEALIDIFPFIYFLLGFFSIIYLTDSIFVSDYPQLLIVSFGFQFAKMLGLLQLSHLTKARFNPYNITFLLPNLCFIIHSVIYYYTRSYRILFISIDNLIWFFFIFNILSWFHYVYYCSEELCIILGIYRFSLRKRIDEANLGESEVKTKEINDIYLQL